MCENNTDLKEIVQLQLDVTDLRLKYPKLLDKLYKKKNELFLQALTNFEPNVENEKDLEVPEIVQLTATLDKTAAELKPKIQDLKQKMDDQMKLLKILHLKKDCPISKVMDLI